MKKITTITLIFVGLFSLRLTNKTMSVEEAVNRAEIFVRDNGYTIVLVKNTKNLSYELFDYREPNDDSILIRRHNTLQSKAFCYIRDKNEWYIGFLSSSVNLDQLDSIEINSNLAGRAVIVNDNGKEIRIAHKTPLFSYFTKIKQTK